MKVYKEMMKILKNLLKYLKVFFVLIFIAFEEFLWKRVGVPVFNLVKEINFFLKLKFLIENIKNKYKILFVFIFVVLIDNSLTIVLGYSLTHGLVAFATILYIIKAFLSILTVLIFKLGRKQLVKFSIIKYGYYYILKIKYSETMKSVKGTIKKIKISIMDLKNKYFSKSIFKNIYKVLKK